MTEENITGYAMSRVIILGPMHQDVGRLVT
jgi:hypothetical protein